MKRVQKQYKTVHNSIKRTGERTLHRRPVCGFAGVARAEQRNAQGRRPLTEVLCLSERHLLGDNIHVVKQTHKNSGKLMGFVKQW